MKYLKLYESYLTVEKAMEHLRTAAKGIVQSLPTIPRKQGADLILEDNLRIVVRRLSASENIITFLEAEVYMDDKHIGNINFDFISEAPNVLVSYDIDSINEGFTYGQRMKKILANN